MSIWARHRTSSRAQARFEEARRPDPHADLQAELARIQELAALVIRKAERAKRLADGTESTT